MEANPLDQRTTLWVFISILISFSSGSPENLPPSQCSILRCLRTGSTVWANGVVCRKDNIIPVKSGQPFCLGAALRSDNAFRDWTATSRVTIENVTFPNTYSLKDYAKPLFNDEHPGKPDTCYTYLEYPKVEAESPGALVRLTWIDQVTPEKGSERIHKNSCLLHIIV